MAAWVRRPLQGEAVIRSSRPIYVGVYYGFPGLAARRRVPVSVLGLMNN